MPSAAAAGEGGPGLDRNWRGLGRLSAAAVTAVANMSGSHLSKEFFELVKAIGESKSKQEEDRIIMHEV